MANYLAAIYKLPDQLVALETYMETVTDSFELRTITIPERSSGKTIVFLWHKQS